MPITQTRMLSLIDAAEVLYQERMQLIQKAKSIRDGQLDGARGLLHELMEKGEDTLPALESINDCVEQLLEMIISPSLLDFGAISTIAKERAHFQARGKSNISAANYHRRKRALSLSADTTGE